MTARKQSASPGYPSVKRAKAARPQRPRSVRAREKVLLATDELLTEEQAGEIAEAALRGLLTPKGRHRG